MFGFGKKKKRQQNEQIKKQQEIKKTIKNKKHKRLDKLVMGAIIGVAVGSVVGASIPSNKQKKAKTLTPLDKKELKQIPNELEENQ